MGVVGRRWVRVARPNEKSCLSFGAANSTRRMHTWQMLLEVARSRGGSGVSEVVSQGDRRYMVTALVSDVDQIIYMSTYSVYEYIFLSVCSDAELS